MSEDIKSDVTEEITESNAYEKSLDLIKESMKSVIAEFIINLKDGSTHIAYITKFEVGKDYALIYEFCTPSEDRKAEIGECVEDIFKKMIDEKMNDIKILSF